MYANYSKKMLKQAKGKSKLNFKRIGKSYLEILCVFISEKHIAFFGKTYKKLILVLDGKEYSSYHGTNINKVQYIYENLFVLDDKAAFIIRDKDRNFVVHGNKKLGAQYDDVRWLRVMKGKLAFIATKNNKEFVVCGGKKIGKSYHGINDFVTSTKNYAITYENPFLKLVYNGKEIGKGDPVTDPTFLGEELLFNTLKPYNKFFGKNFVVYKGKEYAYEFARQPIDINGKLAFLSGKSYGKKKKGKVFIVFEDKEFGKKYDFVSPPFDFFGKLGYIGFKKDRRILTRNGRALKTKYDVNGILTIGKSLVVLAEEANRSIAYYNNKLIGREYGVITEVYDVNGRLAFIAKKRNKVSFMIED
jgi:hypothetical protein